MDYCFPEISSRKQGSEPVIRESVQQQGHLGVFGNSRKGTLNMRYLGMVSRERVTDVVTRKVTEEGGCLQVSKNECARPRIQTLGAGGRWTRPVGMTSRMLVPWRLKGGWGRWEVPVSH